MDLALVLGFIAVLGVIALGAYHMMGPVRIVPADAGPLAGNTAPLCKALWGRSCGAANNGLTMGGARISNFCPNWSEDVMAMEPEFRKHLDNPMLCGNWSLFARGYDHKYVFDGTSKRWTKMPLTEDDKQRPSYILGVAMA